jgi:hypothetical protein
LQGQPSGCSECGQDPFSEQQQQDGASWTEIDLKSADAFAVQQQKVCPKSSVPTSIRLSKIRDKISAPPNEATES